MKGFDSPMYPSYPFPLALSLEKSFSEEGTGSEEPHKSLPIVVFPQKRGVLKIIDNRKKEDRFDKASAQTEALGDVLNQFKRETTLRGKAEQQSEPLPADEFAQEVYNLIQFSINNPNNSTVFVWEGVNLQHNSSQGYYIEITAENPRLTAYVSEMGGRRVPGKSVTLEGTEQVLAFMSTITMRDRTLESNYIAASIFSRFPGINSQIADLSSIVGHRLLVTVYNINGVSSIFILKTAEGQSLRYHRIYSSDPRFIEESVGLTGKLLYISVNQLDPDMGASLTLATQNALLNLVSDNEFFQNPDGSNVPLFDLVRRITGDQTLSNQDLENLIEKSKTNFSLSDALGQIDGISQAEVDNMARTNPYDLGVTLSNPGEDFSEIGDLSNNTANTNEGISPQLPPLEGFSIPTVGVVGIGVLLLSLLIAKVARAVS